MSWTDCKSQFCGFVGQKNSTNRNIQTVARGARSIGVFMINPTFSEEALSKFYGCDGNELQAGNQHSPSIWLFGIEHGTYKSKRDEAIGAKILVQDEEYSVKTQMRWPYNQKAFKLLASMLPEYGVEKYVEFAEKYKPFVVGSLGFFKGNLYPVPCHNVGVWTDLAKETTGAPSKHEYIQWCREHRLPVIKRWIEEYYPKIFVGVGIGTRDEFSLAVFGEPVNLNETTININGRKKRIFHYIAGDKKLVVIPHFSGPNGLNSNEALQKTGEFITSIMNSK